MGTELERCTITERRSNRNEVSRGSPDKEVNYYYYYFLNLGRSFRSGRQKLILEIILLLLLLLLFIFKPR